MESKHHKRYYALCFSPFDVQEEEDQDNQLEADWQVPQKVLAPEKIWESDRSLAGKDVQMFNISMLWTSLGPLAVSRDLIR